MDKKGTLKTGLLGLSILMGLTLLGFFIFRGFKTMSDKDRIVAVKGLAEMDVKATAAHIKIQYTVSGDDFQKVKLNAENKKNALLSFLKENGFAPEKTKVNLPYVYDNQRSYEIVWRNGKEVQQKIDRYVITQTLTIQHEDIEKTEAQASQLKMELIGRDLTANVETDYKFPELNAIKPQLIAESTKNARIAGEQFANDSQSKLGKIKTASQGQISIVGKGYYFDEEEASSETPTQPFIQRARVVSTIVFFLE